MYVDIQEYTQCIQLLMFLIYSPKDGAYRYVYFITKIKRAFAYGITFSKIHLKKQFSFCEQI